MAKYRVTLVETVIQEIEVEAADKDEAEQLVYEDEDESIKIIDERGYGHDVLGVELVPETPDIELFDNGVTLISLHPVSDAGRRWVADNVQGGTGLGDVYIETHRMAEDIFAAAIEDGLICVHIG